MENWRINKLFLSAILVGFIFLPLAVIAQTGSADGTGEPKLDPAVKTTSATTSETVATSTAAATSTPRVVESQPSVPATSTPRATPPSTNQTPTATGTTPVQDAPLTENAPTDSSANPMLWVTLAILAVLPFGFFVAQSFKKKKTTEEKEDDSKCLNIKKLLEEKLKELTDLKGTLENTANL